mgnify:CR=1 FL=1
MAISFFQGSHDYHILFYAVFGNGPGSGKRDFRGNGSAIRKSSSSEYTWHYAAVSVTLVSALMSYNAANSYNDLSAKNSTLATQYANSSSSSEQASYKSEYDSNASKMKSYKSSMQTWDILTLLGLGWEAYLLMSDESISSAVNSGSIQFPFIPRLAYQTYPYGTKTVLRWNMSF